MSNAKLHAARAAKNDELYTQLTDIENELCHYRRHFKGKTVLCNCDNPFESNFFKYFVMNFNELKLKKLVTTCYEGSAVAEYRNGEAKPYKAVVTTVDDMIGDGDIDMDGIKALLKSEENELTELDGNGDFRSNECLKLMDEADIVVTNPPFSLFREYVKALMEHKKKFIIIGNKNAITYKNIFPLLKDNKMWLGSNSPAPKEFVQRDGTIKKFGNICWYTNLDLKKRYQELILVKKYKPDEYPHYDNYDAIEVNKVANIPYDYDSAMGVPITFMDKYNPEQFEIIGSFNANHESDPAFGYVKSDMTPTISNGKEIMWNGPVVQKRPLYFRIVIRNKHPEPPNRTFA